MKKLSFLLTLSKQMIASMVVLAVLTLGFIATTTSCHNSLTGIDSQELPARVQRAGGSASNTFLTKSVSVHFNVKNGGWGLTSSRGIVSTGDGSYFESGGELFASNFSISLVVPSEETFLVIYWQGNEFLGGTTYLSARLNLVPGVADYDILLKYRGKGAVDTDGLTEVLVWK